MTWQAFKSRLDEINSRPANRAAALGFYLVAGYFLFLVLPVGQWIGFAWEYRLFVTYTLIIMYTGGHVLYQLEQAGDLKTWEAQFND